MTDELKLLTPKAYADAPKPKATAPKPAPVQHFHKRGDDALNCTHGHHSRDCGECHPFPNARLIQFSERPVRWTNDQIREYVTSLPRG